MKKGEIRIEVTENLTGENNNLYSAWEVAGTTTHEVVKEVDGQLLGRIGSKNPPRKLTAGMKKFSAERDALVNPWLEAEYQRAYDAILAVHPELADKQVRKNFGYITEQAEPVRFDEAMVDIEEDEMTRDEYLERLEDSAGFLADYVDDARSLACTMVDFIDIAIEAGSNHLEATELADHSELTGVHSFLVTLKNGKKIRVQVQDA